MAHCTRKHQITVSDKITISLYELKICHPITLTLDQLIGNTPGASTTHAGRGCSPNATTSYWPNSEGNNPAGSVRDRAALSMIIEAERRGEIAPGDTLIEATSGNTGIALAMVAALRGYKMILIMPDNLASSDAAR